MKSLFKNRRLLFSVIGAVLFLIVVAIYLFTRPETGTISVTAPDFVEINSARIRGVVLEDTKERGSGDQSFSVPVGNYVLSGISDINSYRAVVEVTENEETTVAFEEYEIQELSAQDTIKAKYFTKAGNNYRYLDSEDGVIYTYFGSDFVPERYNFNARNISELSWLDGSNAVAIADQQLYRVSQDNFSFLRYPDDQEPELDIRPIVSGYSVNNNGQIFAVIDGGLYRYESLTSEPELIEEIDNFATFPFSSPDGAVALATDTTLSGHRAEEATNSIIDTSGQTLVESFSERGIYFVKWSPDSERFIFGDDVGLWLYSLDSKESRLIVKGSDFSNGSLVWFDESRFLHYNQNQLWEYNVDSGVGIARYAFDQPELLSDFTTPGSMNLLEDELIVSIDTKSAASPSKLFVIPLEN